MTHGETADVERGRAIMEKRSTRGCERCGEFAVILTPDGLYCAADWLERERDRAAAARPA